MTLKSDAQGFLVGELIETNSALLDGQVKANRMLGNIRTEVSAIARVLGAKAPGSSPTGRKVVEPAQRGAKSRAASVVAAQPGAKVDPAGRTSASSTRPQNPSSRTVAMPRGRDTMGRFTKATPVDVDKVLGTGGTVRPIAEPLGRDGKGRFTDRKSVV